MVPQLNHVNIAGDLNPTLKYFIYVLTFYSSLRHWHLQSRSKIQTPIYFRKSLKEDVCKLENLSLPLFKIGGQENCLELFQY